MLLWSTVLLGYLCVGLLALVLVDWAARVFDVEGFRDTSLVVVLLVLLVWPVAVVRFLGNVRS